MQETAGEISWARTAGLTVAVAGFLFVAEPLAALAVILFSGIAPGCDRCSNTQPSALATYLLVAVLAGVGSIGVALVVA